MLDTPHDFECYCRETTHEVAAMLCIADALLEVAHRIKDLGLNADADSPMGAAELLVKEIKDGFAALTHDKHAKKEISHG